MTLFMINEKLTDDQWRRVPTAMPKPVKRKPIVLAALLKPDEETRPHHLYDNIYNIMGFVYVVSNGVKTLIREIA